MALTGDGWIAGEKAKKTALTTPENVVFGLNRLLGRSYDSKAVRNLREWSPLNIVALESGDVGVKIEDNEYTIPELVSELLKQFKKDVEDVLNQTIREVVVIIPSSFNAKQTAALEEAAQFAGLKIVEMIAPTTAAAIKNGVANKKNEKIAVIDLGAGKSETGIYEICDGVIEALAIVGDCDLGGEDLDSRIVKYLIEEFKKFESIDLTSDKIALSRLKQGAEAVIQDLSYREEITVEIPYIYADQTGVKNLSIKLARERFASLAEDYTGKIELYVKRAIEASGCDIKQIESVILVGETVKLPFVQNAIKNIFQGKSISCPPSRQTIGEGAAIRSGIRVGEVKDILALPLTPFSIWMETPDGDCGSRDLSSLKDASSLLNPFKSTKNNFFNTPTVPKTSCEVISAQTTIPTRRSRIISTSLDNQSSINIALYQYDAVLQGSKICLAKFSINDIPRCKRGIPQIEISVDIDARNRIAISIKDIGSGKTPSLKIQEKLPTVKLG